MPSIVVTPRQPSSTTISWVGPVCINLKSIILSLRDNYQAYQDAEVDQSVHSCRIRSTVTPRQEAELKRLGIVPLARKTGSGSEMLELFYNSTHHTVAITYAGSISL